ncbi:MAG: hypothetical protein AAFX94_17285, partial [Myxococcota bacterium]
MFVLLLATGCATADTARRDDGVPRTVGVSSSFYRWASLTTEDRGWVTAVEVDAGFLPSDFGV